MKDDLSSKLEKHVADWAPKFDFPPTPDLRPSVVKSIEVDQGRRRNVLRWAAAVALAVAVIILALPPAARATVGEIVQVGVVRLVFGSSTEPAPPDTTGISASEIDFAGETRLAEAQATYPNPILMPSYPPDLGAPDRVFLQRRAPAAGVVLVWVDEHETVELALFQLAGDFLVAKLAPETVAETRVGEAQAWWTEGPYWVEVKGSEMQQRRLIEGHVLIWAQDGVTYRLETALPLAEARRIAESLQAP